MLPEPLSTIYVNNKPLIILADTGSEVNCVSYRLVEHLGLIGKIRNTKSKCCGPNGSPIETNGEIYLEFYLGNQIYNTKFIVLQLARSTAEILGYQFMKTNNVSIHCGKSITNDPNYTPEVNKGYNISPEYLSVRPVRDYEISQHSVRSIELQISDYPKKLLAKFLLRPFYIFKRDEPPQVATLNHKCQCEYELENKSSLLFTEETADIQWGYEIPVARLNLSVEGKKIRKIYPKDLLQYDSFNSTLFEWFEWFWH